MREIGGQFGKIEMSKSLKKGSILASEGKER